MVKFNSNDLRAVLFDLDNTLVDRDEAVKVLAKRFRQFFDSTLKGADHSRFIDEFVRIDAGGTVPDKQHQLQSTLDAFTLEWNQQFGLGDWWRAEYPSAFRLDPSVDALLSKLEELGLPWGIVTNGSALQMNVIDHVGLTSRADCMVISSQVGMRKPSPEIFEYAIDQIASGVVADNVLFVGDNPTADIGGARDAGMSTAWVARGRNWQIADYRPDVTVDAVGELVGLFKDDWG